MTITVRKAPIPLTVTNVKKLYSWGVRAITVDKTSLDKYLLDAVIKEKPQTTNAEGEILVGNSEGVDLYQEKV